MVRLNNILGVCLKSLDDDHRSSRAVLIGLLGLALSLRLVLAFVLPVDYRYGIQDSVTYVTITRNMLTLGIFGLQPGVAFALVPPGYPLFLAAVFAVTHESFMAVRLVQVVLGTFIVGLTYLVGREFVSKNVLFLGVFLASVYPAWLIYNLVFMSETLYTVLFLLFTWCLVRSLKQYSDRYSLLTGATFGLALLTRETFFALPVMLPLALWWSRMPWKHAVRYLLLFTIATLVVLSPWLLRNYRTFGHVFYTERTERIRYLLTGSGYLSPTYEYLVDESRSGPSPPPDYYERFGHSSEMLRFSNLLERPGTYLRHLVNRFIEFWFHPHGLQSLPDITIVQVAYVGGHLLIMGFAGLGLAVGLKRRDVAVGALTLLLIYITGTCVMIVEPRPRYTLPFLPLIFVLTAIGLGEILKFLWHRRLASAKSMTVQECSSD